MKAILRPAIVTFVLLSLLTGVVYPLAVTGVAQTMFPRQANGSLISRADGRPAGSSLIGQEFSGRTDCFWSRPSATDPAPYTAFNAAKSTGSAGSNLGPTNPVLLDKVRARVAALRAADDAVGFRRPVEMQVPIDLVTASASGLDPHISPAAAEYQVPRVARARRVAEESLRRLVREHTQWRTFGCLGEPVVNVLELNLDLERVAGSQPLR